MNKKLTAIIYWSLCISCAAGIIKLCIKPQMSLFAYSLDVHPDHRSIEREAKLRIERSETARKTDARQKGRQAEQKKAEQEKKKRQEEKYKKEEEERKERLADLKIHGDLLQKALKRK